MFPQVDGAQQCVELVSAAAPPVCCRHDVKLNFEFFFDRRISVLMLTDELVEMKDGVKLKLLLACQHKPMLNQTLFAVHTNF